MTDSCLTGLDHPVMKFFMSRKKVVFIAGIVAFLLVILFLRSNKPASSSVRTISKLSSLNLDTARTSNTQDGVLITGARVESSDYKADDYLIITYQFNLDDQNLEPVEIQAFKDVGPTTSGDHLFFLRDTTEAPRVMREGVEFEDGNTIDVNKAPQTLTVKMLDRFSKVFS